MSNASQSVVKSALDRSGLTSRISKVYSCEEIGKAKPHRLVYDTVKADYPGEIWMIAAHAWDLHGASKMWYKTAWDSCSEKVWMDAFEEPTVQGVGLEEMVEAMLAYSQY